MPATWSRILLLPGWGTGVSETNLGDEASELAELEDELRQLDVAAGAAAIEWIPLTGGVSSEIWKVELGDRTVCVKRARPKLAVAAEWNAPVERNESEVAWLEVAREISADAVPRVLGHRPDLHFFVMEFFDAERYPVWKAELAKGTVDEDFATKVGERLGAIHASTARNAELAERFATDDLFHSLRLEPYLAATAAVHPDLADRLGELSERTADTRLALVHGDVSPKNILMGPNGPVFLDAECAWYGDPAFDVAFCGTHLLLKCFQAPASREALLNSFDAFVKAYSSLVDWEPVANLQARVASLIPALLLARVDGKSPVEYLTAESDKDAVRGAAREMFSAGASTAVEVRDLWERSLPT